MRQAGRFGVFIIGERESLSFCLAGFSYSEKHGSLSLAV